LKGESKVSSGTSVRQWRDPYHRDDTGWISFGAFLIIVAVIYLTTPNIANEVKAFVRDFQLVQVFENFWWFVPRTSHPALYAAAERFCYAFGLVQVGILGLRLAKRSSIHAKAQTVSSIVFWLGAGYVFGMLSQGVLLWLSFIAALIILIGISIVVRALVLILSPRQPM
jgi:hypothetical protein